MTIHTDQTSLIHDCLISLPGIDKDIFSWTIKLTNHCPKSKLYTTKKSSLTCDHVQKGIVMSLYVEQEYKLI